MELNNYIESNSPLLDHIRRNGEPGAATRRWFEMPPATPEQEEVDLFADGLIETSQLKLSELLDQHDFLENRRKHNIAFIQKRADSEHWDEISEWFWTYWENYQYSEIVYVQRWVKYWMKVYEMAAKVKFEPIFFEPKSEITDEDVARAKEVPLEELYDGNLRHSFGRLMGLCPFHEEKSPSFTIFQNDNHFYCFGCHTWGDAIDFYMKKNQVNMVDAVKALNGR